MAFSEFVTTVTKDRYIPKVIDNVLGGNILLERMLGNARSWGSGTTLKIPIKYQTSSAGGSYSGFDTLSTSQQNTRTLASYDPKQNYFSVVINGIQKAVNQGDAAVLDLLAVEMASVQADMTDELGTQFYSDGTGNSSKDITGLAAAVAASGTYGGITYGASTYPTWLSDVDVSSNAITLAEMRASHDAASIGNDKPTLIVTTPAIWTTFEGLLTATINYYTQVQGYQKVNRFTTKGKGGQTGDIGFDALYFRGVPVVADEKCTSGYMYMLNENHLWMSVLANADYPTQRNGFAWTGLKMPTNQDASVGQFLLYAQMICDSRRTQALLTNKS